MTLEQVVGVNTEIATLVRGGGSIGIGFAIPIDRAAQIAGQIVADAPAHVFGLAGPIRRPPCPRRPFS